MKNDYLSELIIGESIKIHKALGPGLLENVYETILYHELSKAGLSIQRQVPIPVSYEGVSMETGFRADMIVENEIIIEIKSIEDILPVHAKIMLTYLKLSGMHVGLIINFRKELLKSGIKRIVHDWAG